MIEVSIIILNYKSRGLVRQQLLHLRDFPPRVSHEIIVVDNDSRDGIVPMMQEDFPHIRCIAAETNRGFAAGNNIGMRKAQGRFIVLLNPDIVLTPGFIDALHGAIDADDKIGILGPKILNADGSLQYSCVRFPNIWLPVFRRTIFAKTRVGKRWLRWYFMKDWAHDQPRDVEWLFGACSITRREALDVVGLLDERFFLYLEDTDWCRRFWEAGWRVTYDPRVSVIHLLGRQSEGAPLSIFSNKHVRHHLRSFAKYLLKYRGKTKPHVLEG